MNEQDSQRFSQPVRPDGGHVRHRRSIADRQQAAQRLLMSAMDEVYDGDLDIDWDSPVDPDLGWLPDRLSSLYGTDIWAALTDAQRRELGRHELVNLLSFAVYAEAALTMLLFRNVGENRYLADDFSRWTLKAIEEETRNASMFTRLINKAGLPVYRRPTAVRVLAKTVLLTPSGVFGRGAVLLVQEVVHVCAAAMAADPSLQRHVRQLMRIHESSGTRHIEFSRSELLRALDESGAVRTAFAGHALAVLAGLIYPMMLNDKVYADSGLDPRRARNASRESDQYGMRARAVTDSFVRFAVEAGLFGHRSERWLLQRAQVWPSDVSDDVAAMA